MNRNNGRESARVIDKIITVVLLFAMGLLLCWSESSHAASAKDTKKQTVSPSSTETRPGTAASSSQSSKVTQLLNQLMQAQTLKQYNDLLKNANLNTSERESLSRELAQSQYANKVNGLLQSARTAAEAEAKAKADKKTQELIAKQQQNLNQLNQQTREHHQRQLAQKKGASQASVPAAAARQAPVSVEGLPHIRSVSSPITPGDSTLTIITGEDFMRAGETAGRVSLKIGRTSTDLPVVSYTATVIQARVPAELCDTARREMPALIEEGGVIDGMVEVHTARGTSVAAVQLQIPVDESKLIPKVFSVIPKEFQPGQLVSILGENFLNRAPGTVIFHLGSQTIKAIIIDWASIGILAQIPADISGMKRTSGTVEVKNYVGHSVKDVGHVVTFLPVEVAEKLDSAHFYHLQYRYLGGWSERKVFFDFDLVNEWRVVDRRESMEGDCRVDMIRYPALGSADPRYEVSAECGRYECFYWSAWVTIQGPRGLPYK